MEGIAVGRGEAILPNLVYQFLQAMGSPAPAPSPGKPPVSPTPIAEALLRRWTVARRMVSSGLKARVHEALKEAILARELLPGDEISEREIERIFHVSRIPVREALKVLEAQGWIATQPRRGTRILGLDLKDVREIYQLREHLEPFAARLAANAMTPAQAAWFRRTLKNMERSVARHALAAFIKKDLAVHTRIARLSGNARLEATIVGLSEEIRRLGTHSISVQGREQSSLDEHRALFHALWAHDGDAAAHFMLTHLVNTRATILTLITAGRTHRMRAAVGTRRQPRSRPLRHRRIRRTPGSREG